MRATREIAKISCKSMRSWCAARFLRASRRGAVLVLVLVVLSLLSLLSLGLCHRVRLELKVSRMRSDEVRAYYLAVGGLRRAMFAIRQDQDEKVDHFGESWRLCTSAESEGSLECDESSRGESEGGSREHVFYSVSDEEARLNLNTSSPAVWMELPGVNETIVHSILDWQDGDDSPNRDGAETGYYQRLGEAYRAKNDLIAMLSELALIKGVSWQGLMGEDANGNQLLDETEDDGVSSPADNGDGELDRGLVDFFTVYGQGKVNLNTVGPEVLAALPGIELEGARALLAWRVGPDGEPFTGDDRFLKVVEELKQVFGLTERQMELLAEYGTVASGWFRVVVEASAREGGRSCRLMATVRREGGEVRLVWVQTMSL